MPWATISRERELAWLEQGWGELPDGPVHLLLVGGEAGVGKTRLAQAFADRGTLADVALRGL